MRLLLLQSRLVKKSYPPLTSFIAAILSMVEAASSMVAKLTPFDRKNSTVASERMGVRTYLCVSLIQRLFWVRLHLAGRGDSPWGNEVDSDVLIVQDSSVASKKSPNPPFRSVVLRGSWLVNVARKARFQNQATISCVVQGLMPEIVNG